MIRPMNKSNLLIDTSPAKVSPVVKMAGSRAWLLDSNSGSTVYIPFDCEELHLSMPQFSHL